MEKPGQFRAEINTEKVRWEQTKGSRVQIVEWNRTPRKNEWRAWSEPMPGTKGQKKALGGSNGVVPAKQAISELEDFLA